MLCAPNAVVNPAAYSGHIRRAAWWSARSAGVGCWSMGGTGTGDVLTEARMPGQLSGPRRAGIAGYCLVWARWLMIAW
jgi:hypothetical protein